MKPELPEFDTLPPQTPAPVGQADPGYYEKPVEVSSHVNKTPEPATTVNFDPKMRRQWSAEPDFVHATRPIEPEPFPISDALKSKHEESKKQYPFLNLSEGEFVIADIRRHFIGLVAPIGIGTFIIIVLLSVLLSYPLYLEEAGSNSTLPSFELVSLLILPLIMLTAIFAYIAVWIYQRNKFYLTNESVIQEIQTSLFAKREQTASLGSIEDVSFHQAGILQTLLNYGSIRLSTEGDETTYRYYFVLNPREQVVALTNAVEAFKNGRPVGDQS